MVLKHTILDCCDTWFISTPFWIAAIHFTLSPIIINNVYLSVDRRDRLQFWPALALTVIVFNTSALSNQVELMIQTTLMTEHTTPTTLMQAHTIQTTRTVVPMIQTTRTVAHTTPITHTVAHMTPITHTAAPTTPITLTR